jgi:hypothetical protein
MCIEGSALFLVIEDVLVDSFVANSKVAIFPDDIGNLFGAKVIPDKPEYKCPLLQGKLRTTTIPLSSGGSIAVGCFSPIAIVVCTPVSS